MTKYQSIKKTPGDGYDRIEWLDARGAKHSLRATDPVAVEQVLPGERTRKPGKYAGQRTYQGHYWCAGTQSMVFHESMTEFTGVMLIDHLHDLIFLAAQPMLLTFAAGDFHYPDYLAILSDGTRLVVDIHLKSLTSEADARKFELTRGMCQRLGWQYALIDGMSNVVRWNLELMARYQHPRYSPSDQVRTKILRLARRQPTFQQLRTALRTDKPGEHLPALFHMLWRRELHFDITEPFTDDSPLSVD